MTRSRSGRDAIRPEANLRSDRSAPSVLHALEAEANPGRRKILALLIASAFVPPLAHAASSGATGAAGQRFMALSLFATGRAKLDPQIAAKLLSALRDSDASFVAAADSLAADAASGKYPNVESLEAAIRDTPRHAALLGMISAWYTGTVSVQGKPQVITTSEALMYQASSDGSHIPGVCSGATNSWAELPYPALASMPVF